MTVSKLTAQDTMDALKGIKHGLFQGHAYTAEYVYGDSELPNRWFIRELTPKHISFEKTTIEHNLYRHLNPNFFPTELHSLCWTTPGSETWIEGIQAERAGGNNHYGQEQCSPKPGETCPACGYTWSK